MKKRKQGLSIRYSMIKRMIVYVFMPLFIALAILCFLLQKTTSQGISEAFQLMFNQNVQEIDNTILLANYASSSMIAYTENYKDLKNYYAAESAYEKYAAGEQLASMLIDINATILRSFKGDMMLLMNDGRMVNDYREFPIPEDLEQTQWYQAVKKQGQQPYWDNDINYLFVDGNEDSYVTFGREVIRYQQEPLGYAVVRIPKAVFERFKDEERFREGTIVMFSADGRILTGDTSLIPEKDIMKLYHYYKDTGAARGRYGKYYMMTSKIP